MINSNRIVPVKATDLITLYGLILNVGVENGVSALAPAEDIGVFEFTSTLSGNQLCSEPVVSLDFASGVSSATVYFVAAYDYEGMTINDVAVTPTGTVSADGSTLYKAVLADGAVTITKVGF